MTIEETALERGAPLDALALPLEEFETLRERLARPRSAADALLVGNLWGSSQPLLLAWLALRDSDAPFLAVTGSEAEAEAALDDLVTFGVDATLFPARDVGAKLGADADQIRARLLVAQRLAGPVEHRPRVLVAPLLALLQPIPVLRDVEKQFLTFEVESLLDTGPLLARLVSSGYTRQPLAEAPGEVSVRGDILDVFPFGAEMPLRVEMFEDEIESLRLFDPADGRSVESHERIEICIASSKAQPGEGEGTAPATLLDPRTTLVELEPLRVEERAGALCALSSINQRTLDTLHENAHRRLALQSLPGKEWNADTRSVQGLEVGMKRAAEALREAAAAGARIHVLCPTEGDAHRFRELMDEKGGVPELETHVGAVAQGFRLPQAGLVVVNHRELKGVLGSRRRVRRKTHHRAKAIQSFFELKKGDLVVHAVHGLARYAGLEPLEREGGGVEEHLHLFFANDVSLYVPSSRVDVVQRYIGTGGAGGVTLDKIGGTSFRKRKEKVEKGLFDLAADLIDVQARRALKTRPPWPVEQELVDELIAEFPYTDTDDQATVDVEVAQDIASGRPMDRLLCGDVGFGKTEIAVRAAFRVVSGGGQVAVLVPTTVLARQHFETFAERMADFPVEVATVSRYVSPKDIRATLERVEAGAVDVLIGTHRILSKDVKFKKLGLVIVDEEQRFGVTHKEHFKKLRANVDLLTLTATPIPRTLHMSLAGIRDISALSTPPDGRQEIQTILGYNEDEDTIREALEREKNRGGQVFYLHNRVASIDATAARLAKLVPDCTFAIGHGQMPPGEMRKVMNAFTHGEADVLVATTIIENGIDIPSAGTILVEDAERFGLSELHQLRGRVGRGDHKGYCYLMVERNKPLRDIARKRLKALEEMNHLGAGFGISIKDLELRGAGNVLGAEQSGHIAAIGYDMYCRLLKTTIERLQAGETFDGAEGLRDEERGVELELGLRAFLPDDYVPSADTRLEVLRQLSEIESDADADRAEESLRDRFGKLPKEARELVRVFRLRALLAPFAISRLAYRADVYLVQYDDPVGLERLFGPLGVELRRIKARVAHLVIPAEHVQRQGSGTLGGAAALAWFEGLLKGHPEAAKMSGSHGDPA